jgi:hypothetical protein
MQHLLEKKKLFLEITKMLEKTQEKEQLKINLSYFSFRFCINFKPKLFRINLDGINVFHSQNSALQRVFLEFSFVNKREKIRFQDAKTLIPELSELDWDCKYPKFRAEICRFHFLLDLSLYYY